MAQSAGDGNVTLVREQIMQTLYICIL